MYYILYVCIYEYMYGPICQKKDQIYNTGTIFAFVLFEVKKMKSKKFERKSGRNLHLPMQPPKQCLEDVIQDFLRGLILNNGTQYPAEKLNVWRLKSEIYLIKAWMNVFAGKESK